MSSWSAIDSLCEPLLDCRVTLFDALQQALPVILEEDLNGEEAKKRLPEMKKHKKKKEDLQETQAQLVQDNRELEEKNQQLKIMQKELTREILEKDDWNFFKCEVCQKIFVTEKFLQDHLEKRHYVKEATKGSRNKKLKHLRV